MASWFSYVRTRTVTVPRFAGTLKVFRHTFKFVTSDIFKGVKRITVQAGPIISAATLRSCGFIIDIHSCLNYSFPHQGGCEMAKTNPFPVAKARFHKASWEIYWNWNSTGTCFVIPSALSRYRPGFPSIPLPHGLVTIQKHAGDTTHSLSHETNATTGSIGFKKPPFRAAVKSAFFRIRYAIFRTRFAWPTISSRPRGEGPFQ